MESIQSRIYAQLGDEQLIWEFRTLHDSLYGQDGAGLSAPESYYLMANELDKRGYKIAELRTLIIRKP